MKTVLQLGAQIVRSLISEGYSVKPRSSFDNRLVLHHDRNHNVMHVILNKDSVSLYKNGAWIKTEYVSLREH